MTNTEETWNSDWAEPPGSLILECREQCGISPQDFAGETGLTLQEVEALDEGTMAIDYLLAECLAKLFRNDISFWLRLQSNYEADVKRLANNSQSK
jgi:plasmid maintenance system antidote protein VapI